MAIKKIERKPLSLAEKTYLPQIVSGLKITLKNIFKPTITLQYPEERPEIPENYRGVPTLVKDPNGREKCVSCQLCEFVCPPKAIRITPGELDEEGEHAHVEKGPQEFEVNMLRCIYCGYCQEACPVDAIVMGPNFEYATETREELFYDKARLLDNGDRWEAAIMDNIKQDAPYR